MVHESIYLADASDHCLSIMDLLDNSPLALTEKEAKRIHDNLRDIYAYLLTRVQDDEHD